MKCGTDGDTPELWKQPMEAEGEGKATECRADTENQLSIYIN